MPSTTLRLQPYLSSFNVGPFSICPSKPDHMFSVLSIQLEVVPSQNLWSTYLNYTHIGDIYYIPLFFLIFVYLTFSFSTGVWTAGSVSSWKIWVLNKYLLSSMKWIQVTATQTGQMGKLIFCYITLNYAETRPLAPAFSRVPALQPQGTGLFSPVQVGKILSKE